MNQAVICGGSHEGREKPSSDIYHYSELDDDTVASAGIEIPTTVPFCCCLKVKNLRVIIGLFKRENENNINIK